MLSSYFHTATVTYLYHTEDGIRSQLHLLKHLASFFASKPLQQTAAMACLDAIRERFAAHGQEHVLRFVDEVGDTERTALLEALNGLNLEQIAKDFTRAMSGMCCMRLGR